MRSNLAVLAAVLFFAAAAVPVAAQEAMSADQTLQEDSKLHEIVEIFYAEGVPKLNETQGKKALTPILTILEHALTRASGRSDQPSEAHILILLGEISLRSGDAAKTIELSTRALDLGRSIRADDVETRALTSLSQAYIVQKDFATAIRYEQELLSLVQRNNDSKPKAAVLGMLATTYLGYGDLDKAVTLGEQAWTTAAEQHLEVVEASALRVLIKASNARFDSRAAIHWSEEALRLARSRVDSDAEREALLILGEASIEQGDYGRAITACSQGLSKATAATEPLFLHCLGVAYDDLQDDKQAGEFLERALGKARELKDPGREAEILAELGRHHFLLGESQPAAKYYEQSARLLLSSQGSFAKANAESYLGLALVLRGDAQGAVPHFERALDLFNRFASIEYPKFKPLASNLQASTMRFLVDAYEILEKREEELAYAEREWESQKDNPYPTPRALALSNLGMARWRMGRLEPAAEATGRAITEWEAARSVLAVDAQVNKAALLDVQGETYELLERILLAQGKPEAALEIAERGRARAFVEALSAKAGGPPPMPPSLDAIRKLAKARNVTLIEYSILYDPTAVLLPNRVGGGQPQFEKELLVWVVKPSGEIGFKTVDLKAWGAQKGGSLAQTVRWFRASVRSQGHDADSDEPLRHLYNLLITPIAELLPSDPEARIVFVPQGPLFLVPFPALRAPSGRYLLEDHTILSAPSIDSLASIPRRTFRADWNADEVLVAGNPTIAAELKLAPYKLRGLPESGKEAAAIASRFGARPLLGDAAGKAAILQLLPQRRLLHLATHGLLEGFGDPLIPGALVLAPGKDDDGLLTAKEVLGLDLHADLAVLSACDTGGGRITSDGVIGLSRAFLSAGVPSVVVSLWSIPDAPTSGLMQRFYRELKGDPDPGRALRQAMLATMKEHPRPGDWAGFTLIGGLP
ncbi:MAG TPA: CHAT domain-containing protein [Thermoanaerobaculia bacterium]|nr:CHAT domain-containing protein [Thermoanaerobaculia bacterium]